MLGLFGNWFGNSTPQAVPPISPAQVSTLFAPQRMPMNRDNIVSQIFAPPYWTPSDLDYYGGETPQMRFNFRKFYRTEPSLKAALDGTTSSLSSSETSVIPEDKDSPNDIAAAEFNEWGIEQTPRGMRGLIEDINRHARLDGYFVGEIKLHQVTPEESLKWAGKWRVDHVRVLDTIWINLELDVYRNIVAIVNTVRGLEYYDPSEVLFYSHKPLYNVPFGQSDFRATTRAANILEDVYKVWYVALKLYGYPYLIGKVKSGTRRQMMENALTALHASGYAVTDVEESIEVVNLASAASYDAFQTMIQTQREDVNMVFRGSSLPFQEGQGGNDSHGDTQVASKASDAEEESMGFHIAHTIRRQLFNLVTAINFPRGTGVPHLQLGGTNWDTTAKRVATMKDAQSMGAKIKKAWFYKETGIVPADDNDPNDALEAPKEPAPDGGGMPGSGGPPGAGPQPPFGGNPASPKPKPPAPTEQTMSDGSRSEYVARLAAQLVDRAKGADTFADEYDRDEKGQFAPKGLSGVHAEWKRATGRTKEHLHDAYYNTVGEDPGEKPLRGRIDKKLLSRRVASAHAALHDAGGTAEELKPLERAALHAGLTKVHNTGDVTTFDPEMHVSDVGISEGTPVRVVRPGWHRDDGDGRVMRVVGAKVEPMPKQFSDDSLTMPIADIYADPDRFQFRRNADDDDGTARELPDEKFDLSKCKPIGVWDDPDDGKTYVVDGHHRRAWAERDGVKELPVWRIQADTAEQAKAIGKAANSKTKTKQFSDDTTLRNPTAPDIDNGQHGPGVPFAEDAQGHEHRGKGKGGGQFVSKGKGGGGDSESPGKPAKKTAETSNKPSSETNEKVEKTFVKPKAVRGEMHGAKRVGTGKDAKIVLEDGQPAPEHITAGMVPPAWTDVKVSADPDADVFVTARDDKGRPKTVYNPRFAQLGQDVKFARVKEGVEKAAEMHVQNLKNLDDPKLAPMAAATWLMMEQATRPGSDSDTKGLAKLYGQKLDKENFEIGEPDKNGIPSVTLHVGGDAVPIRDKKARAIIADRVKNGGDLYDSTYWLKSHGATTLEGKHVVKAKDGVRLQFMGKEGVWHDHLIRNPKLAAMLTERAKKAGPDGSLFGTDYAAVTKYAKTKLDSGRFTPKDFRTMKATSLAVRIINEMPPPKDEKEYKAAAMEVAKQVSHVLGNEPAQALESYIAPEVFAGWRSHANA